MSQTNNQEKNKEKATGRYVYDKKLGKVVKVSDEVVGLKKGRSFEASCPMNKGGRTCGGCCGG